MVIGLDLFKEHFKDFTEHYILIGGSACDVQMEERALEFRVTKDLDIILIVEALNTTFVNHFWDFIRNGEYVLAEVGSEKRFYRFIKPKVEGYPYMLELFAKHPETLAEPPEELHITDIPTDEEASSLSAILLDEPYYQFTLDNCEIIDGLRLASNPSLICLKTRAFLNNKEKKEEKGINIRDEDIYKHRRDVFRLLAIVDPTVIVAVPETIQTDLYAFIGHVDEKAEDVEQILKSIKLNVAREDLMTLMKTIFAIG